MSAPTIPTDALPTRDRHPAAGVGGPNSVGTQDPSDRHGRSGADGPNSCGAHVEDECHTKFGAAGSTPAELPIRPSPDRGALAARSAPTPPVTPSGQSDAFEHAACPEGSTPSATPFLLAAAKVRPVSLADPFLALAADVVDDLEKVRIANENRLRQLTRTETDADGVERGFGLDETHRDVARLAALIETLAKSEHEATLNLARHMRKHPLGAWVKTQKGVGEKQAARLLASIGDPSWNTLTDDWRTLRQLYSYCGYGDAERQVRRRGEKANWDATAKMRVYLIAASCVQVGHGGPYRALYDEGRARYANAVHEGECRRCGPAGRPAQPGSPLSNGHQDGRARRLVCKAILRDLWREARRLHGFDDEEAAA